MSGKNSLQASPMSLFEASGSRKYLNMVERRRFFRAAAELPVENRLFCLVSAWSGGRISEVLALTPAAFDLDAGAVAIQTLKRRKRNVVRQVFLPPDLLKALRRVFNLATLQMDSRAKDKRLWPYSRVTAWRLIKRVMRTAGVHGVAASPKGLRHSFGVLAFEMKVPPHLVQRWLGHSSLKTTVIYADVIGTEERAFAKLMWQRTR